MSEFKYACPVCGQHIKCDSSQAGTVMNCPTCFQKITVPQAPAAEEQKYILTGTKVGERPTPTAPGASASGAGAAKGSPAVVVLFVVLLGAAAAAFVFREKIFHTAGGADTNPTGAVASGTNRIQPPRPILVAPPANDTNWTLNLAAVEIPNTRAAGRIHGQDFIVERAILQGGTLTLRYGTRGPVALGLVFNFGGVQPESLAGQSLDIATNAPTAARVSLRWPDGDRIAHENLNSGYAMRLKFGPMIGNHLRGDIYFCAPDEAKSYVAGTFNAEIRKPKPRQ